MDREATAAVPVLAAAAAAVMGAAAATARGLTISRSMPAAALLTGLSKKRSPADGAGTPRVIEKPSITAPLANPEKTWLSDCRVTWYWPALAGSLISRYSLALSAAGLVMVKLTLARKAGPAAALVAAGSATGAPCANIGAPLLPARSMPKDCWVFMATARPAAIWPSRLRASTRSSFCTRSKPASAPLPTAPALSGVTCPPTEIDSAARCGSNSSALDTSLLMVWLNTRLWPPAMNTLTLPSGAPMALTSILALMRLMS